MNCFSALMDEKKTEEKICENQDLAKNIMLIQAYQLRYTEFHEIVHNLEDNIVNNNKLSSNETYLSSYQKRN